jgi:hypothetical protein
MKLATALASAGLLTSGLLLYGLHAAAPQPPDSAKTSPTPPKQAAATAGEKEAPRKPIPHYRSVRIANVPHVRQRPDFCGEACAEMALRKLGYAIDQDDVFDQSGLDPELGRGCYTRELWAALSRIGFDVGPVWYHVTANRADTELESRFRALHADLAAGIPSIVCTHYDDSPDTTEHFRLVLGYDKETDEVIYHEPAVARGAYLRMAREQLLSLWPLKYEEDRWTLIRFRLKPNRIRNVHSTAKFTGADYAQQVMRVKSKAPEGFSVVIQRPFVVAGDEPAETVRRRATGTVKWAVDRLKRAYFTEDPDDILEIWLFKDKESYEKHTEEIFNDWPDTPFGYYSHTHKALIMNIDTGGGTLVHEIVHPFVASNFSECPSWFNEGLASLYEQCGDRRGQIWGYTNWRLKGLQETIQAVREQERKEKEEQERREAEANRQDEGQPERPAENASEASEAEMDAEEMVEVAEVPTFEELCNTTTFGFYMRDPGTNYAQARYLCYYLQQRGLLGKYYHQFRRNVADDPSGYKTLKDVLGLESEEDMLRFKEVWESWILTLRFP